MRAGDGLRVGLEHYPAQVIYTPGHTQGSVCLHFAALKLLVAGDTLFEGSIGRTDLPGGDYGQIIDSIQTRLLPLPDETRVLTGHGPATTIGAERRSNPFCAASEPQKPPSVKALRRLIHQRSSRKLQNVSGVCLRVADRA